MLRRTQMINLALTTREIAKKKEEEAEKGLLGKPTEKDREIRA